LARRVSDPPPDPLRRIAKRIDLPLKGEVKKQSEEIRPNVR